MNETANNESGREKMKTVTIAQKTVRGRTYTYLLKQDEKGFYWDGLQCASWRRKTRASVEAFATRCHCDVTDTESV